MHTPGEIAKNYVGIGKKKVATPPVKLFLLGILAGIFIGIGATGYEIAVATFGGGIGKFAGAFLFPAGLALVLLAGSELFTGNCLLVIPLLEGEVTLTGVIKSWICVYLGNFAGSVILAFLIAFGHTPSLLDGGLLEVIMSIAAGKVGLSFGDAFLRGIVCNVIVCLAVWMSFAGKTVTGKIAGLYLPIVIFVLGGFEHSIANMYYFMVAIFSNAVYDMGNTAVTLGAALTKNLLPVTLGNLIGGASIGIIYWYLYLKVQIKEKG